MEKDNLIRKWLADELTDAERTAFEQQDDYKDHLRVVEAAKYFKASEFTDVADIESFYKRYEEARTLVPKKEKKSSLGLVLKIVAVFVIMLGIGFLVINPFNDRVSAPLAQKQEVVLPDNSEVVLNADSEIEYNGNNWQNQRSLRLKGEAYFKVAKGKRFDVVTEEGTVTVLGTKFNVKSRIGFFEVHCYEGLVNLTLSDHESVNLPAGSRFRIIDGKHYFDKTPEKVPGWINNRTTFKSIPYIQVIREFERQYNVNIDLKNINQNQIFTGGFVHNSLEDGLKSITLPLDLSYTVDNTKNITITTSK
ncbi:FecR family protein [Aquimarina brevivitae]|uniref:FecR family protein n=1 Tax=Aquimarina brevivitae TaxID=323412 RepID=A0A4V2F7M1_9FLAO|nr:FecR family protein [Aquimarina brevivitae]RZT00300.1 FecR family protein [Aquimarina brevivitae]